MLPDFSTIPFSDPTRAAANLARIEGRLPPSLHQAFSSLLAQTPAPDDAVNFLERFLHPEAASPLVLQYLQKHPASLHYLLTIFSYSRFLSETLLQQPDLITTLLRPTTDSVGRGIDRSRTAEDLDEEFARFEATSLDLPPAVRLARFKRREYLRIMLRDVLNFATLAETTLELSQLADLLLERALLIAGTKLEAAYGAPQTDAAGRSKKCSLAVIALGKLGGEELNYNSDIDLMFLYPSEGITSGGTAGATSNHEFFIRQAQAVLQLISENTPEGAVFRVDLRLRPQGGEGELAISLPAALDYYRTRAREWELQSLIRARGSAGDRETARRFLREVRPLVYQREFRLEVVEAVLNARQQITRTLTRRQAQRAVMRGRAFGRSAGRRKGDHDTAPEDALQASPETFNVKLSPGGIRDIEFLAQCLQRLYGGEDTWLQAAPTLVALQRLHDKGHLSGRDFNQLAAAYQLFRTIEHRLQLRDGLQRHELPHMPDSLDRLARRCGIESSPQHPSPGAALLALVAAHSGHVREIYTRQLARLRPGAAAQHPRIESPEDAPAASALLRQLERDYPNLGTEASRLTAGLESANYLRRGLAKYLNSALLSPALMARLELEPGRLRDAAALFERSDLAVDWLAYHPEEIERVGATAREETPWLPFAPLSDEQRAEDLRRDYRRGLLRELAAELLGESPGGEAVPFPFLDRFTQMAESALRDALQLASDEALGAPQTTRSFDREPFAVLALGRIGSREMSIGSDADLIFLVDDGLSPADRALWRRITERLVQIVGSHTREGVIFAVDTRLRPRGAEGELTPSFEALARYLADEAAAWEALSFLKLRPVAGNPELGTRAASSALTTLRARFGGVANAAAFAADLKRIRARLDQDALGPRAKGRLKKMAGGYYDLEYVTGFLSYEHAVKQAGGNAIEQIEALAAAGALDPSGLATLRQTAILYRAADHAARLITGRPLAGWPEPALAARITRLLRQWGLEWQGDLRPAMQACGKHLRALYREVLTAP